MGSKGQYIMKAGHMFELGGNSMRKKILFICLTSCFLIFQSMGYAAHKLETAPLAAGTQSKKVSDSADTQSVDDDDEEAFVDDEDYPVFKDPNQNFNRVMFSFNDKLDAAILKPLATVYDKILPKPLNQGVSNFFNNIRTLPTIANDILQLHFYQAVNDMWRLTINTTIGIGGLFDVATRIGLTPYTNDFGMTLARYGYTDSNYLVWPFFGPGSFRDGIGWPVDYYLFSIYPHIHSDRVRYGLYGLGVVDRRAQLLEFQGVVEEAAIDKYVFIRNAFLQRRAFELEQNQQQGIVTKRIMED